MRVTNQMMSTTYLKDLNKNLNNFISHLIFWFGCEEQANSSNNKEKGLISDGQTQFIIYW